MSPTEFSSRFDVLYNNVMSNAVPGLDEYEKSVILTKAQDEILKNHVNPAGNKYRQGFDDSSKRQLDFSKLTKVVTLTPVTIESFDSRGTHFQFPTDVFHVINEKVTLTKSNQTSERIIVPLSSEEYRRLMSKPYHEPLKRQAWRIINGQEGSNSTIELILAKADEGSTIQYKMMYIRKPRPIITTALDTMYGQGVTINGLSQQSGCELDEVLHEEILQRAVELAKAAYGGDVNGQLQMQNQITVGQRSE